METTRDNDSTNSVWFEVQVKGVELKGDQTILLLEKCHNQDKYPCAFPAMLEWLKKRDNLHCIQKLATRFVYAKIDNSTIVEMKTYGQSVFTEERIAPQDWNSYGTPTVYRSHAPSRGRESGGMQKCPNCGADTETIIVRSGMRIYHKCLKCCALMETAGGRPFT